MRPAVEELNEALGHVLNEVEEKDPASMNAVDYYVRLIV